MEQILNTTVFSRPTALYGCETWAFTAKIRGMLLAFESKCYRRIMRVKWTQKITNDTIFSRVDREKTIMQKAIRRKMTLFEDVARMGDATDARKLKRVMFGVMKRKNQGGDGDVRSD